MIKSYAGIAASVASLGAGVISFATSFGTLEKAQNRVDQSSLTLERSQAKLAKMQQAGTYTAEELARQQEDVRVKTNLLTVAQGDLADTTMNFYAQMPAQLISFGTAATTAFTAYTAASGTSTGATHLFSAAVKKAMISIGPIGWAIMGISTVVALFATNTFGLRDALWSAGKAVHEFLNVYLKPLGDLVTWLVNGFSMLAGGLDNTQKAYGEASDATSEFANETVNAGSAIGKFSKELEVYRQIYELSNEQIALGADYLEDQARAAEKSRQENFNLVASIYDLETAFALNNDQLDDFADALKRSKELQDEATQASEDEANAHKEAIEQIRERVQANIALAESMGINVNASKTTVGETDRIKDHLERLKTEYERSRERVEEFAIAHNVDVVKAVQASDDELVQMIKTLGGVDSKTAETRRDLISDFAASRDAVANFTVNTGANTDLASQYWAESVDSMISDSERLQNELDDLIDKYEDVARAASRNSGGSSSNRTVTIVNGPQGNASGIAGRGNLAQQPNAEGGIIDEYIFGVGKSGKTYSFGERGPEMIIPIDKLKPQTAKDTTTNVYIENKVYTSDPNTRVESRVRTRQATMRRFTS